MTGELSGASSGISSRPLTRGRRERFIHFRDVTLHLVRRELSARHRDSLLGWLWTFVPAVLQLMVYAFLFTRVIPLKVPNYGAFLFVGILGWALFATGLQGAAGSLEHQRSLVLKPGVPTAAIPLATVLVSLVDYVVALPVLLVVLAFTTSVHATVLLLPLLLIIELVLTAGLAFIAAPLQIMYRDIVHLVSVLVLLGFWLTPIFYTPRNVPGRFHFAYTFNPLAQLIRAQRDVLLAGQWPSVGALGVVAALALTVLAVGIAVFRHLASVVPERL